MKERKVFQNISFFIFLKNGCHEQAEPLYFNLSQKAPGQKAKDGKAPLSIRLTIDGKISEISLSRKILPEYWDEDMKQVSGKDPEAKIINKKIVQAQVDLDRYFISLQAQHTSVTPEMVKNLYEGRPAIPVDPAEEISCWKETVK